MAIDSARHRQRRAPLPLHPRQHHRDASSFAVRRPRFVRGGGRLRPDRQRPHPDRRQGSDRPDRAGERRLPTAAPTAPRPTPAAARTTATPARPGTECASDFCVEGVCCNSACNGVCESCVAGQRGRCDPAPDGTDPKMQCGPAPGTRCRRARRRRRRRWRPRRRRHPGARRRAAGLEPAMRRHLQRHARLPFPGHREAAAATSWCNTDERGGRHDLRRAGRLRAPAERLHRLRLRRRQSARPAAPPTRTASRTRPSATPTASASRRRATAWAASPATSAATATAPAPAGAAVCCNSACDAPFTCTETPGKCKCPGVTCAAGVACQVFYRTPTATAPATSSAPWPPWATATPRPPAPTRPRRLRGQQHRLRRRRRQRQARADRLLRRCPAGPRGPTTTTATATS